MVATKFNKHPKFHNARLDRFTPKVIYVKDFDEEDVKRFAIDFNEAYNNDQDVIPIVIDSVGGWCYGVLAMIDIIEACDKTVATICIGKAMSSALSLACWGWEGYRYAAPSTVFMFHQVNGEEGGNLSDREAILAHDKYINRIMNEKMSLQLGHDKEYFTRMLEEANNCDLYLTAKEAKKRNIINHIKIPSFDVSLEYSCKFS